MTFNLNKQEPKYNTILTLKVYRVAGTHNEKSSQRAAFNSNINYSN
jgi:hypothetical protein